MTEATTLYEVRILGKGKISRHFVDTIAGVSELIKGTQDKQPCVYRIQKSSEGTIISSEELKYRLRNNTFIFKTQKSKPFTPKPDSPIIERMPEPLVSEPQRVTRQAKVRTFGGLHRLQKTAMSDNSTLRKKIPNRASPSQGLRIKSRPAGGCRTKARSGLGRRR